ncbi:RecX family transcriptional regulator [Leifsonia sp. McL0607]|uniref:RecX family transcriptional regulator n=1 Tax=Leifsonia sp. McL0607 TaxID=3415672 RepID=UPI003CEF7CBF
MVVRFPSEPHPGGDSGAGEQGAGEQGAGEQGAGEQGTGEQGTGEQGASEPQPSERLAPVTPLRRAVVSPERRKASPTGAARPLVELPGASSRDEGAAVPAASSDGESTERWNNTWATDPGRASEVVADVEDEETERFARKTTALTVRQLARRGMSRWELEQLLTKREIAPEVFAPELDQLEAMGVIDDASLAATLAFAQHSRKGLGRSAIELDLRRRHIAPELIEGALADIADEDELERATELAVKRIGQLSSYDDETARRRLHGFLARKGYGSSVMRQAMEAAFATRERRGGVRFQ